jgi:hypothetical protein
VHRYAGSQRQGDQQDLEHQAIRQRHMDKVYGVISGFATA